MDRPNDGPERVRERIAEIDARRQQVHTRLEELSGVPEHDEGADVRHAAEYAEQALRFARTAHANCRRAHADVARVHDGAARLHDRMARMGVGDVEWHVRRAADHRRLAEAERSAARDLRRGD